MLKFDFLLFGFLANFYCCVFDNLVIAWFSTLETLILEAWNFSLRLLYFDCNELFFLVRSCIIEGIFTK